MGGFNGGLGGGGMGNSPYTEVIHRVSDENGVVDFGVVQPGDWQFDLVRKWKGQGGWRAHGSLNVLPGIKIVKPVVCPKAPPDQGPVTLRVAWPGDLAANSYLLEAVFTHAGVTYQSPVHWTLVSNPNGGWAETRAILCGSREGETKQADLHLDGTLYYWQFADPNKGLVDLGSEKNNRSHLFADLRTEYARLAATAVKLDVGSYNLTSLAVLRARPPHKLKAPGERFDVLAYTAQAQWGLPSLFARIQTVFNPPDEGEPTYPQGGGFGQMGGGIGQAQNDSPAVTKSVRVSDSFWQGENAHFAVQKGPPITWTIELPDEIVKFLREQLKREARTSG